MKVDYDVGIVGGGPAGSTLAAYLARAGLSCAVFEAERFPRPHVGESLVPATTPVLLETGAMEAVDRAGFCRKYGAAWTSWWNGPGAPAAPAARHDLRTATIRFDERPQRGVPRDYTFHVDRGRFDHLLLDHAAASGADVFEGVRVPRVRFADPRRPELTCRTPAGTSTVRVRMVADASGRRTLLGTQLGHKVTDPVFDQYAVHTWFEDLDRAALATGGAHPDDIVVHFLPLRHAWVWQIPISDRVTSVGIVTRKRDFTEARTDLAAFFWQVVGLRGDLRQALAEARQVRPFKPEGDYSYAMREICGDGLVMIGDAARFVDPIFSSGVSVAMNSARLAAADIVAAAEAGDFGKARFRRFESRLRCGIRNWYRFITLYYRLHVLFTVFVNDPRYRGDMLQLLQGDVYDEEEPRALVRMAEALAAVERNPDHLWHGYLTDLAPSSRGADAPARASSPAPYSSSTRDA